MRILFEVDFTEDQALHMFSSEFSHDTRCGLRTYRSVLIKNLTAMNGVYVFDTPYISPCPEVATKRFQNKTQEWFVTGLEYNWYEYLFFPCRLGNLQCGSDTTTRRGRLRVTYSSNTVTVLITPGARTPANDAIPGNEEANFLQYNFSVACPLASFPFVSSRTIPPQDQATNCRATDPLFKSSGSITATVTGY
jgi:hypothetical protein